MIPWGQWLPPGMGFRLMRTAGLPVNISWQPDEYGNAQQATVRGLKCKGYSKSFLYILIVINKGKCHLTFSTSLQSRRLEATINSMVGHDKFCHGLFQKTGPELVLFGLLCEAQVPMFPRTLPIWQSIIDGNSHPFLHWARSGWLKP